MRSRLLYLTLSITALLLSACGKIDLTIDKHSILPPFVNPFSVPTSAEIVSGSIQNALTPANHYVVNTTTGTMIKDVQSTTVNGYKISYGLDGELVPTQ